MKPTLTQFIEAVLDVVYENVGCVDKNPKAILKELDIVVGTAVGAWIENKIHHAESNDNDAKVVAASAIALAMFRGFCEAVASASLADAIDLTASFVKAARHNRNDDDDRFSLN